MQSMSSQRMDDFLRKMKFGSEVYYVGQLCDAWQLAAPRGDAATFHLVCHGQAWVHMPGEPEALRLYPGDLVFFPRDAAHAISGQLQLADTQECIWGKPGSFHKDQPGTGLVCGHLRLPLQVRRLLLASFPELVLIRPADSPVGSQLKGLINMMSAEALKNELGVTAILDRLADILFLFIIRHIMHVSPALSPVLAALADKHLNLVVTVFIEKPEEEWTVERMARLACQSRSVFSERFRQLVGMPPMEFVANWRMQLAVAMLQEDNAGMLDIALRSGYESEAAFRKAFKRITGVTPGSVRALK